jgi:hypothetical protein
MTAVPACPAPGTVFSSAFETQQTATISINSTNRNKLNKRYKRYERHKRYTILSGGRPTIPIDHILAKFSNLRSRGRGYLADCPLHPDQPAVLRLTPEYGQLLLECPSGCPDHKIMAALGMTAADLTDFDDPALSAGPGPDEDDDKEEYGRPVAYGPGGEVVEFEYFDEKPLPVSLKAASEQPKLRRLFGEFWHESELTIMFADTGKGKSILAVQIADSINRGVPLAPLGLDVPAQRTLYFDFELSDKMFEARYSSRCPKTGELASVYPFSMEFRRAQPSRAPYYPDGYDSIGDYIHESFVTLIERTQAKVVIIDNITFLNRKPNERAGGALRLIAELQRMKSEHGLSILALAHTPKRRYARGLTVNDLQGSKMLANFADNIFAVGESCLGDNIRYLKHIKPRNTEMIYGASNVCTYRIEKETNFLGFKFIGFNHEREHLESPLLPKEAERRILATKVKELKAEGHSVREISRILGISRSTVERLLKG